MKAGDKTEITDFTITADDGSDYSQDYFNEEAYVFMLVAYDISKTKKRSIKKINTFVDKCNVDGNYIFGLTSSAYNYI